MLAAHEGHTTLVEQLICAGSSVNAKSLEGRTAVHYATLYGHIDCVEKLLEKEADVNIYDSHGITPLNYAAKEGVWDFLLSTSKKLGGAFFSQR